MTLREIKIGDRVFSKRTGLPGSGTVVGIVTVDYWLSTLPFILDKEYYNNLYPEWDSKYIVYVEFDEPQRAVSFDEFIAQTNYERYEQKILYKHLVKAVKRAAYPIDDLEIL